MQDSTGATARRVLGAPWGSQRRKERSMLHDDLARWIIDLRDCLVRGKLVGLGPIELGYGTRHLPGETTIRVMLADLVDLTDPERLATGDTAWRAERLAVLLDDFKRLRELLGERSTA
jgi:hypothetical protein